MDIQVAINEVFLNAFGRTPLRQRMEDLQRESIEIQRWTDLANLREEAGDLLASLLQLCNECGWQAEELIAATLDKIARRQQQYQSLGRKINVAILGGAFNPPTIGHIEVAQYVLEACQVVIDEVWLMPCYKHMHGKVLAPADVRLRLCSTAIRNDGRLKIFDYEIRKEFSGETYQLVKTLLEEPFAKNEYNFSLIMGMDNANTCEKTWSNWVDLERLIRFVIVPRRGTVRDTKVDWYLKPPHLFLGEVERPIPETASTEVRHYISVKRWDHPVLSQMLDPEVLRIIRDMKLYRR